MLHAEKTRPVASGTHEIKTWSGRKFPCGEVFYLARCECMSSSIELNPAVKSRLHASSFQERGIKSAGGFRNRSRSEIFVVLAAGGSFVRCRPDATTNV